MATTFSSIANSGYGGQGSDPNAWMSLMPGTKSDLSWQDFTSGAPGATAAPWTDLTVPGAGMSNLGSDYAAATSAMSGPLNALLAANRESNMNRYTDAGGGVAGGTPIALGDQGALQAALAALNAAETSQNFENLAKTNSMQSQDTANQIAERAYYNQANQQAQTAQQGQVNAALEAEKATAAQQAGGMSGSARSGSGKGGGGGTNSSLLNDDSTYQGYAQSDPYGYGRPIPSSGNAAAVTGFGNIASATNQAGSNPPTPRGAGAVPDILRDNPEPFNPGGTESFGSLGGPSTQGQSPSNFNQLAQPQNPDVPAGQSGEQWAIPGMTDNSMAPEKIVNQAAPGSYYFASSLAR